MAGRVPRPDGPGLPSPRALSRAALQVTGHYGLPALPWLLFTTVTPDLFSRDSSTVWNVVAGVVLFLLPGIYVHERYLCARCVGALPLNPQAAVERAIIHLLVYHLVACHVRPVRLGAYLLGVAAVQAMFLDHRQDAAVTAVLLTLPFATFLGSALKHRRLRPWCPWCRSGGGGDDDGLEDPGPPHDPHGKTQPVMASR